MAFSHKSSLTRRCKHSRKSKRREKGSGIHFNEASCAACHVAPRDQGLPGGSGPITEIRAGHLGTNGEFIAAPGGTLITTKAVGATPEIMALSPTQNIRDRLYYAVGVWSRVRGERS